jgi:hypothetical protein
MTLSSFYNMLESYAQFPRKFLAPNKLTLTRASTRLNYHMLPQMLLAAVHCQRAASESSLPLLGNAFVVLHYPTAHKSVQA